MQSQLLDWQSRPIYLHYVKYIVWQSLPHHALWTLIHYLAISKLDYCNTIFARLSSRQMNRLQFVLMLLLGLCIFPGIAIPSSDVSEIDSGWQCIYSGSATCLDKCSTRCLNFTVLSPNTAIFVLHSLFDLWPLLSVSWQWLFISIVFSDYCNLTLLYRSAFKCCLAS